MTKPRREFRPEINGLRAWAVVAAILYHFRVPGFQGGFVGVDVFFVISGFLMTGLIIGGLEGADSGMRFSLWDFYLARARRTVPALAGLCVTLLVLGWFYLSPFDFRQLGEHVVTALGFVSNLKFWREAGYFDVGSHEKWLLHTWSLSVEWQFYLLLPLMLTLIWRRWPDRTFATVWLSGAFLASLLLSGVLTSVKPNASFYLLPTRAWELLAGGLVFMLAQRLELSPSQRRGLELAGFCLILAAVTLTQGHALWPGWLALVPVMGTVSVLVAARPRSLWTNTPLAQWLGSASYSLYLWHWPVVVALLYLNLSGDGWAVAAGIFTTMVLGHLSWRWVEQPSRAKLAGWSWKPVLTALAGMVGVGVAFGAYVYLNDGVSGRLDPHIASVFAEGQNKNPRRDECLVGPPMRVPECMYGGRTLGAIVIGDSHAASLVRTVEKAMANSDRHVLDWSYSGCPTLAGVHRTGSGFDSAYADYCGTFVTERLAKHQMMDPAPLLIVNRLSVYTKGPTEKGQEAEFGKPLVYFGARAVDASETELLLQFRQRLIDTTCQFAQRRATYLLRPIPELGRDVPRTMGRALLLGRHARISISLEEYHARHHFVWQAQDAARVQCGVTILDPLPYLCHDGRCWGDKNGLPLYFDDDHLNEHGAALLLPLLRTMFR